MGLTVLCSLINRDGGNAPMAFCAIVAVVLLMMLPACSTKN